MGNEYHYEDFEPGNVYRHAPGKTVTEAEHILFCMLTHNTHPIHMDAHYAKTATKHGKVLVVSSYLYSVLLGLSADIMKKVAKHIEFDSIRHVAPVFHGDSIYGESTVLAREPLQEGSSAGVVLFETRGHKQDGTLVISFTHRVAVRSSTHAAA